MNWQPKTDSITARVENGFCVLTASRRSPAETVRVVVPDISLVQALEICKQRGFLLAGSERPSWPGGTQLRSNHGRTATFDHDCSSASPLLAPKGMFLTLPDRILEFLAEHPSSTARTIAEALGELRPSVASYLSQMSHGRAVIRSKSRPFTYRLPDPSDTKALPNKTPVSLRKETSLADEQLVLAALTEGRASDHETLLALLNWAPKRFEQTVDRLHSARLVETVDGSYVLIPRSS